MNIITLTIMIYLVLLIIAIFLNAIMDADSLDVFGKWAENRYTKNPTKFNKILWEWVDADSWENKYKVADLLSKYLPKWIATWLAKDVLVIFLDLWHFAKALMMICFEIPIAVLTIHLLPIYIPFSIYLISIFMAGGVVFNLFYYRLRKIFK